MHLCVGEQKKKSRGGFKCYHTIVLQSQSIKEYYENGVGFLHFWERHKIIFKNDEEQYKNKNWSQPRGSLKILTHKT